MALAISNECINCDVCAPACPNEAINPGTSIYEIDPHRCTECIGHHDRPRCVELCPVDCIAVDAAWPETRAQLRAKARLLIPDKEAQNS